MSTSSRPWRGSRVARAAVLLVATACAKSPEALYRSAVDDQTELLVVYEHLGTALRMRGTYLSDAFRVRLADERRRLAEGAVTDADHADFLRRSGEDGATYHEVVLTVETDIPNQRVELGTTDDTWRIRMDADGVEQPLVTVYRVRDPSSFHQVLFPHKNIWNELWIARFEKVTAHPDALTLHVGSGYGHDSLTWTEAQLR